MKLDQLYLWYLGDPSTPKYVGELQLMHDGKGVSLRYGQVWLEHGFPLSADLPLIDRVHLPPGRMSADSPRAVGAVDDARPDRWGEKVIRYIDRPKRLSLMEFLYYAGDDRFGALGVSTSPDTYLPRPRGPLPRLSDAQQLSEVAAKIEASEALTDVEAKIIAGGGSPLGGAKPKALIEIEGAQWVIKFFNNEPVDTPLIEHAAMTLAKKAGIHVAETRIIALIGAHAIAIRRFDRHSGTRVHCISAGTAIRAVTPAGNDPEMGYPALAGVLRRSSAAKDDDRQELFRRMVFNILIDNTDDHEKNHALLVDARSMRTRLAPAYDVLPTNSGQGHQEFVCGLDGRASTLKNAMSQCEAFGLGAQDAAKEVSNVIAVVNTWQAHFRQTGVSQRDIDALAQWIDGEELLQQRASFDVAAYQEAAKRSKKAGPFKRP